MANSQDNKEDLFIESISFNNFRNIKQLRLEKLGHLTIINGPNAVGKTNLIEGIQLLSALYSFRHPLTKQLINSSSSQAYVSLLAKNKARELSITLNIQDDKKTYTLNGKKKKKTDLKGLIPAVTFTPDDMSFVKGAGSLRRAAIDALGSQISLEYYLVLKDYEKVIKYKNILLRDEVSPDYLTSINETLLTCGAQLSYYRLALVERIIPFIINAYKVIANNEALDISYTPSWIPYDPTSSVVHSYTKKEALYHLREALIHHAQQEHTRRRCLVGPHADHLDFFLKGHQVSLYASQGQQRSIVLAFKIAECQLIKEVCHQQPLLLLDDVMSELDEDRRHAFLSTIEEGPQTFITTTNLNYFESSFLKKAHLHTMNP